MKMQKKAMEDQMKNAQAKIGEKKSELFKDKNSPVFDPSSSSITIVEFFDYSCGYCKKANEVLSKLFAEDKKIKIPRTISCKNISILEDTDTKLEIPRKTPYKAMNAEENMLEFNDKIIIQYNSNPKKEDNKTIINRKIVDAKLITKTRLNMSNMFDDFNCYCCKNYLTIHDNNVINYFLKYDTMNKTVIPRSSNSIRTLYKLRPDLFINENLALTNLG